MKEIGGYIEFDESNGKEYHTNAIKLNSGRHCLEYLIRARRIKKIFLPYFLCKSVRELCDKCKCQYEFYHIDNDFKPIFNKHCQDGEYLYIVNYYGQFDNNTILDFKDQHINIILDNTQAFFQMPVDNVDTIYTCRKFFGVSDGGYLYTNSKLEEELTRDYSYERIKYILGRYEVNAQAFFADSKANNLMFSTEKLKLMSRLTCNMLKNIDYNFVIKRRTDNFVFLHSKIGEINKLPLTVPMGAFMYPLYIDNADSIKKELIKNKIYVPTLWSDVFDVCEEEMIEYRLAKNIIPLPVDQRYTQKDMEYIYNIIQMLI